MSEDMATDPFSSKDILKLPTIRDDQVERWHGFQLDNLRSQSLSLAEVQDFSLPSLKPGTFQLSTENTSIEQIDVGEDSKRKLISDDPVESSPSTDESADQLWNHDDVCSSSARVLLAGWDEWTDSGKSLHDVELFSEAKAAIHDLVNSKNWHKSVGGPLQFIQVEAFQNGVVNLVLGHSSAIFEWNDAKSCFQQRIGDFALTGFTQGVTQNICDLFTKCGTTFRQLSLFSRSEFHQIPTMRTLQGSISRILDTIRHHYISNNLHRLPIIRLIHVARSSLEVLALLERLQNSVSTCSNELEMLTVTVSTIDEVWMSKAHFRPLLTELCTHLLQPVIDASFQQTNPIGPTQRGNGQRVWLLAELLPNHESRHDEMISNISAMQASNSTFGFTFDNIPHFKFVSHLSETENIIQTANEWETRLLLSPAGEGTTAEDNVQTLFTQKQIISSDPFIIDFAFEPQENRLTELNIEESFANSVVKCIQQQSSESPYDLSPLQALEHTTVPALLVQHRISSYALMRTLFLEHNLVVQLNRLHSHQLLGDGLFTVRLSMALFNSEQDSAEGLRKTGLSAGLRLEDRELWPPASSELRLVLMSLLSDPITDGLTDEPSKNISFAFRELPEDRLDSCRNLHSIHALDFLRIVYTPTDPLMELVITPSSLEKYDCIFGFLLILLRIHSLTQSLLHTTTRLRNAECPVPLYQKLCRELYHIMTNFMDYALNVAIAVPWKQFSEKAYTIHHLLLNGQYQDSVRAAGGIAGFRQSHEEMLDNCMKSLLLKERQHEAYNAICKIFSLVLEFASMNHRGMNTLSVMKRRNEYLNLVRSLVSQVKIQYSTHDPALERLEYLLVQIDSDFFGSSEQE